MNLRHALLLVLSVSLGACMAVPGPPQEVGDQIVVALDAGDEDRADDLFRRIEHDPQACDEVYPVLYSAANERYTVGEVARATSILRFMAPRYPRARSVREALVMSLFLERAQRTSPDPSLLRELDAALDDLGDEADMGTPWRALVATQTAIDQGRIEGARDSYERFLAHWNGTPAELAIYVDDLGRYLASGSLASADGGLR